MIAAYAWAKDGPPGGIHEGYGGYALRPNHMNCRNINHAADFEAIQDKSRP